MTDGTGLTRGSNPGRGRQHRWLAIALGAVACCGLVALGKQARACSPPEHVFPFAVPEGNVVGNAEGGKLNDWFVDDGEAFEGTIEVRVVDRASAAGASTRGWSWAAALLTLVLMLQLRRRSLRSAAYG